MKLRTSVDFYRAAIWSALGLSPLSACGGAATDGVASGNNGGLNSAGTGSLRGSDASAGGAGGFFATGGVRASGGAGGSPGGAGSGGAMTGGGPGSGGVASGGSDSGTPQTTCRNPQPYLGPNGEPTGLVSCDSPIGAFHRATRVDCPSIVPRTTNSACQGALPPVECATDSDCTQKQYGHCEPSARWGGFPPRCSCSYGCTRDSECATGEICLCGSAVGQCVPANCATDADCGGLLCLSSVSTSDSNAFCDIPSFACQTPADQCTTGNDCSSFKPCVVMPDGHRACRDTMCGQGGVGRPFIIDGSARLAPVADRSDWRAVLSPNLDRLTHRERAALAERWTEIGLMEHASIAANARFALELLSLGAPSDLVREAIAAADDETVHARDAFALASAYSGRAVGPGPLDVSRALATTSPADIVRTAIIEGCIGETVAAVETAEALACAEDESVRTALVRAAADEIRHAELVWRFVRWAVEPGNPRLRKHIAQCFAEATKAEQCSASAKPVSSASTERLEAHGLLASETRLEIRRRVIREIVEPSARRLLAGSVLGALTVQS